MRGYDDRGRKVKRHKDTMRESPLLLKGKAYHNETKEGLYWYVHCRVVDIAIVNRNGRSVTLSVF
jgi:hypothetical protein